MNVGYEELNTEDVAKMFKVARCTISGWCNAGFMKATDVSGGAKKSRYLISEDEVKRVKRLIKKYGKRDWFKHAEEGVENPKLSLSTLPDEFYGYNMPDDEEFEMVSTADNNTDETSIVKTEATIETLPTRTIFDPDRVLDSILRIQDIKERLQNLEAEKNQLSFELEQLRKEITAVI